MTKSKKLRVLRDVYDAIPSAGCKGLCHAACTSILVFPLELELMEKAAGRRLDVMFPELSPDEMTFRSKLVGKEIGKPCQLLVVGRCTIYQDRPLICRVFGVAEGLRCPHGCRPDELVPDKQVQGYIEKISAL